MDVDEVIADAVKLLPHKVVTVVGAQRKQQAGMPVDELPVAGVHLSFVGLHLMKNIKGSELMTNENVD